MGRHPSRITGLVCMMLCAQLAACSDSSFSGSTAQQKAAPKTPAPVVASQPPTTNTNPKTGSSGPKTNVDGQGSSQLQPTNGGTSGFGNANGGPGANGAGTNNGAATIPANAVTQGSFTVWAEPAKPAPFQDYQIFIQVTLPGNAQGYTKDDLSGQLSGTDGYQQSLASSDKTGQTLTPEFTVNGQTAILKSWVPGSYDHVNDSIDVHSNLLNESQTITITFQ